MLNHINDKILWVYITNYQNSCFLPICLSLSLQCPNQQQQEKQDVPVLGETVTPMMPTYGKGLCIQKCLSFHIWKKRVAVSSFTENKFKSFQNNLWWNATKSSLLDNLFVLGSHQISFTATLYRLGG